MIKIPLTKNQFALIDDADYNLVSNIKWHYDGTYAKNSGKWAKPRIATFMHKLIMNCPPHLQIDHIDRNGINNQRNNLRICTHQQNSINRSAVNKLGVRGITETRYGKYMSKIKVYGKTIYLGTYDTIDEASAAYQGGCKIHFGQFRFQ